MVVSIDHLEICFGGGSWAEEKGFPAASRAPTDPSAAEQRKITCSSSPGAFSLGFVQKWGLRVLILFLTAVCILLPEDNKLWEV